MKLLSKHLHQLQKKECEIAKCFLKFQQKHVFLVITAYTKHAEPIWWCNQRYLKNHAKPIEYCSVQMLFHFVNTGLHRLVKECEKMSRTLTYSAHIAFVDTIARTLNILLPNSTAGLQCMHCT